MDDMDQGLIQNDEMSHYALMGMDNDGHGPSSGDAPLATRREPTITPSGPIAGVCQIIMFVLMIPFSGLCMAIFGFQYRGNAEVLFNESDGALLMFIGGLFQASLIIPVINVFLPDAADNANENPGDYYGPWAFYALAGVFFGLIGITFIIFSRNDTRRVRQEVLKGENVRVKNSTKGAEDIRRELKRETQSNSLLILGLSFAVSLGETAFIRSCALNEVIGYCSNGEVFLLQANSSVSAWLVTIFWFLLFFCTQCMVMYSVLVHYQQMREVEEFTLITKKKNLRHAKILKDLNEPKYLAMWASVWELLVQDVKYKPATRALTGTTFAFCVLGELLCWGYIAIRNVYVKEDKSAEFTSSCIVFIIFGFFIILGMIRNAMRMDRAIGEHEKRIARVQNDVQTQLDMSRENDPGAVPVLTSKVRVLQSLDVYLRVTDSKPKLMGASLETLRWSVIIVVLFLINCFFIALIQDKTICTYENPSMITIANNIIRIQQSQPITSTPSPK